MRASDLALVCLMVMVVRARLERLPLQDVSQEQGCLVQETFATPVLRGLAKGCLAQGMPDWPEVTVQGWGCQA